MTIKEIVEGIEDKYIVQDEVEPKISISIAQDSVINAKSFLTTWQPTLTCTTSEIIKTNLEELEQKIRKEKENSKMDFNEIIEIYKRRKEKEYQKEFDKESLKLTEEDEIVKIIKKAEKEINTKFIKEFEEEICLGRIITKETNKKREEIKAEFNKKYVELNVLLEEVQAQIKAIPNDTEEKYYFAIEILKNYEILDEKGKINA